jgi:hypothetical protein
MKITEEPTNYNQALARSISGAENVEHIFAEIPSGEYEIVVNQFSGNDQHFALAWRYGNPAPMIIPGDFNNDTRVNGLDFLEWQRGNSPNPLSASDLADWQNNYGIGSLAATTAVPEPSCLALLIGLVFLNRNRN